MLVTYNLDTTVYCQKFNYPYKNQTYLYDTAINPGSLTLIAVVPGVINIPVLCIFLPPTTMLLKVSCNCETEFLRNKSKLQQFILEQLTSWYVTAHHWIDFHIMVWTISRNNFWLLPAFMPLSLCKLPAWPLDISETIIGIRTSSSYRAEYCSYHPISTS